MPELSYHPGAEMPRKGKETMVCAKMDIIVPEGNHLKVGECIHKRMHCGHLDVGIIGPPNGVGLHEAQKLVTGGGGREEAHYAHRGALCKKSRPKLLVEDHVIKVWTFVPRPP